MLYFVKKLIAAFLNTLMAMILIITSEIVSTKLEGMHCQILWANVAILFLIITIISFIIGILDSKNKTN